MQVFHPFPDAVKSAQCIDDKRLLNQVNEIKVILNTLALIENRDEALANPDLVPDAKWETIAWEHHPNVLLWKDDTYYLRWYQLILLDEWVKRHYDWELNPDFKNWYVAKGNIRKPKFFTPDYFKEQQQILLKKNPTHYSRVFSEE